MNLLPVHFHHANLSADNCLPARVADISIHFRHGNGLRHRHRAESSYEKRGGEYSSSRGPSICTDHFSATSSLLPLSVFESSAGSLGTQASHHTHLAARLISGMIRREGGRSQPN